MTSLSVLAELHAREFVCRRKRQDEINEKDRLHRNAKQGDKRQNSLGDWQQIAIGYAGPLCLLDVVGQAEESWLELFENAPACDIADKSKPRKREIERRPYFGGQADLNWV